MFINPRDSVDDQVTTISHDPNFIIPITMKDRVLQSGSNQYRPTAPYKDYQITVR